MTTRQEVDVPASFTVAVWIALLASGLELLAVVIRRKVMAEFAFVGRDVWWTLPLVNVLLLGALGAAFTLAGRAGKPAFWWKANIWSIGFLGVMAVLLDFTIVHRGASILLAAGVATQVARVAGSHRAGFSRAVRGTLPWLLVVVFTSGVVVRGNIWWHEHRALASLPQAKPGSPNVLVIVLDTVRAANLSLYGYERDTTPRLKEWARQGILFSEAFSTAPWTLPSHASILTGRWQPELVADWTVPLDNSYPTLAEALAARGYATAGFSANTNFVSDETGLARGFARFDDYSLTPGIILRSAALGRSLGRTLRAINGAVPRQLGRKEAPAISTPFLEWSGAQHERPWFALLNYFDAHGPYLAPEPFNSRFATPDTPADPKRQEDEDPRSPWTPQQARQYMVAYDGALAYLDAQLGSLFDTLRSRGELDKTLIVITADHGEEFGEHKLWSHGHSLYMSAVHVPLMVLAPGREAAGAVIETPVSLRDIPATVLDMLGDGPASPFPGQSLARFWRTGVTPRDEILVSGVRKERGYPAWVPTSRGDVIGLVDGSFRYIRNLGDGAEELYDFRADPWERHDLSADPASRSTLEQFRSTLERVPRSPARPGR